MFSIQWLFLTFAFIIRMALKWTSVREFCAAVTALVTSTKLSYTSSPVTTGIGDHIWRVSISVFSRLLRPTQPGHPSIGRCNEYWRWLWPPLGKKRRVLRSGGPCYQDCWHAGLLYASSIGSDTCRLKGQKGWAPSWRTTRFMRRPKSSSYRPRYFVSIQLRTFYSASAAV